MSWPNGHAPALLVGGRRARITTRSDPATKATPGSGVADHIRRHWRVKLPGDSSRSVMASAVNRSPVYAGRRVIYRLMDRSPLADGLSLPPAGRSPARCAVAADAVSDSAGEPRGDLLDEPGIAVGIGEEQNDP